MFTKRVKTPFSILWRGRLVWILLLLLLSGMSSAAHAAAPPPSLNAGPVNTARHQKGSQSEGADTSLAFTSNGQALLFNPEGVTVSNGQYALRVGFAHANQVTPQTAESAASREQNVPELSTVTYPDLWDGITLSYDQGGGILRSTYTLAPGADPAAIRLSYNRPFAIQSDGTLTIAFDNGLMLQESAPVAWQDLPGGRVAVEVSFELVAEGMLGFMPGKYDPAYPVTIDPTLSWFTFLGGGGSGDDTGYAITVDGSGNVYVAGVSGGTWGVPLQPFSGNLDAFVAKLNSSGVLQWHTFLGGTGGESGIAIAVDSSGNVYVAGNSNATWGSPVRPFTSNTDGFAAKLNSSGVLQWHTFLGGNGDDYGNGIAVDNSGNVHIAGYSSATWGTPVRAFTGSSEDAYAAKLDSAGNLTWNTFLGGTNNDQGNAIAVDSSGNVYVTGISSASWGTPVRAYTSGGDAFAVRLSSTGTLTWNTFLGGGGTGSDVGSGIAVDSSGNVYVAGLSVASWGTPVRAYSSGTDTFAARLSSAGALTWNTFLGGTGTDQGTGIAVDGSGNLYVSGRSTATWGTPV